MALFDRVMSWFNANYLVLNVGKSHFLIFSRIGIAFPPLTHLQVSQGSLCRPENRVVRFLGILLDENLSFRNHVAMIKQFVVTNCSKERSGSIVTKTLENLILISIATSKESHFNADFKYISFIKFSLSHQKLRA